VQKKINLLWVDLTVSPGESEPPARFEDIFSIRRCGRSDRIERQLQRKALDAVCFDFDYPDRAGMHFAQEVKQKYPSLPMIMTTVQHSEEVAVWAFRSRLADYLVKPIPGPDLDRCTKMLREIRDAKVIQQVRQMTGPISAVPAEVTVVKKTTASVLLPAIYYVEKHYRHKIQSEDVAKLCAMSPFRFSRTFKDEFGLLFRDYVVRYRLRKAYHLLESPQATVTDVAYAVGFNDISYFSRMFKRHFGVSPSALISDQPEKVIDESPTVTLRLPTNLV
jgi:AraC-like DNA-binding protein